MKKLKKFLERYLPYIVAIGVVIYLLINRVNNINNFKDIITSVINFIAIVCGFLTTMLSILMTSSDKAIMIHLKRIKRLNQLYIYITIPIIIGFIDIVFSVLLIPYSEYECLSKLPIFYFFSVLTVLFITTTIRSVIVLAMLMYDPQGDNEERPINLDNAFK